MRALFVSRIPRLAALLVIGHVLAVLAAARAAEAQIAVDTTSSSFGDTAVLSFPHTINPGADALLLVGVEIHAHSTVSSVEWGSGATGCAKSCTPASCLCALTQVGTVSDGGKNVTAQLWKLVNPPGGDGQVVITLPSSHRLVAGATSFFGVDPTAPLGMAVSNAADTGSPASVTVATAAGKLVVDAVTANPNTTLTVAGVGQTQLYQASASAGTASSAVSGAGSLAPGATSVTMSWSLGTENWAIIAVPINPAPTPTGPRRSPTPSPSASPSVECTGDCSGDGMVTVDELLIMVNIALEQAPLARCTAGDANHDGAIDVTEIIAAVDNALNGCGGR